MSLGVKAWHRPSRDRLAGRRRGGRDARHDPSTIRVETPEQLVRGERIEIDIPKLGRRQAEVVSGVHPLYDCILTEPLPGDPEQSPRVVMLRVPDPVVIPWSGVVRVGILVGGAIGSWLLFLLLARLARG